MLPLTRLARCVMFVAPLAVASSSAHADDIDACKSAAEEAEALRGEARLRAARERLLLCARDSCPAVIRNACIQSFTEVERTLPTVVVRARDARGRDVIGVKVLVDGVGLVDGLTGRAAAVDPGPHRIRYVAASGAFREEQVLIAQGERDRVLQVTFDEALEPDGTRPRAAPAVHGPAPGADASRERSPALVPILAVAGVGLAGVGLFTYLQLKGWSDYRDLKDAGCGTAISCGDDRTAPIKAKLIAGDIALGTGLAAIGVASVLTFLRYRQRPKAVAAPTMAPFPASVPLSF